MPGLSHPSIGTLKEPLLVDRLTHQPLWASVIFDLHGFPKEPRRTFTEVLLHKVGAPNAAPSDGDVDVLLYGVGAADAAIAIQVKRITVTERAFQANSDEDEKALAVAWNRRARKKVHEGVEQTNKLLAFGFHQIYLYVLVLVDSRWQNARCGDEITYRGAPSYLRHAVRSAIGPQFLDPGIGMLTSEFVQPMDREPMTIGTVSTGLIRLATQRSQPAELTDWVVSLRDSEFCREVQRRD